MTTAPTIAGTTAHSGQYKIRVQLQKLLSAIQVQALVDALQRSFDDGTAGLFEITDNGECSVVTFFREISDDIEVIKTNMTGKVIQTTDAAAAVVAQLTLELAEHQDESPLVTEIVSLMQAQGGALLDEADNAMVGEAIRTNCADQSATTQLDQAALADKAFAEYIFGEGVEVTDTSGWEYVTPGNERTRKVFVETPVEDGDPAPRWTLTFTVRFNAEGTLDEAYAIDSKGAIWGFLPLKKSGGNGPVRFCNKSVEAACSAIEAHQNALKCNGDHAQQLWHMFASLHEWCSVYAVDFDKELAAFKESFQAGELPLPAANADWVASKSTGAKNQQLAAATDYDLVNTLRTRGLVVSVWESSDFDFLDEESWVKNLSQKQIAAVKTAALGRCGSSLEEVLSQRGNDHLADWCLFNKNDLMTCAAQLPM